VAQEEVRTEGVIGGTRVNGFVVESFLVERGDTPPAVCMGIKINELQEKGFVCV
jgi:hypothetical protein